MLCACTYIALQRCSMLMQLAASSQHRSVLQKHSLLIPNTDLRSRFPPLSRVLRHRELARSTVTDAARKAVMVPDETARDPQMEGAAPTKTVKRKMALHIAYVGTAFRGESRHSRRGSVLLAAHDVCTVTTRFIGLDSQLARLIAHRGQIAHRFTSSTRPSQVGRWRHSRGCSCE